MILRVEIPPSIRAKSWRTRARPSNIFPSTLFPRYDFPFFSSPHFPPFATSFARLRLCAFPPPIRRETREEKGSTKGASLGGDVSPDNGNAIKRTWHESLPPPRRRFTHRDQASDILLGEIAGDSNDDLKRSRSLSWATNENESFDLSSLRLHFLSQRIFLLLFPCISFPPARRGKCGELDLFGRSGD